MALARSTLLLSLALAGCSSAQHVSRDDSGGILALAGQRTQAMKRAREMMLEHCRGPYQILEDGPGDEAESWRLVYRCSEPDQPPVTSEPFDDGYPRIPLVEPAAAPGPIDGGSAGMQATATDAGPSATR